MLRLSQKFKVFPIVIKIHKCNSLHQLTKGANHITTTIKPEKAEKAFDTTEDSPIFLKKILSNKEKRQDIPYLCI